MPLDPTTPAVVQTLPAPVAKLPGWASFLVVCVGVFFVALTLGGLFLGYEVYKALHGGGINPVVKVNGVALGKAYNPALIEAWATGWDAAADSLEKGGTMADAQKAEQDRFKSERIKSFTATVAPTFAKVLPAEGSEPRDAEQRAEVVKLWRDLAKGARGGN